MKSIVFFSHSQQISTYAKISEFFRQKGYYTILWLLSNEDMKMPDVALFDKVENLNVFFSDFSFKDAAHQKELINWLINYENKISPFEPFINKSIIGDRYFNGETTGNFSFSSIGYYKFWTDQKKMIFLAYMAKKIDSVLSKVEVKLLYQETNSAPYILSHKIATYYGVKAGQLMLARGWRDRIYFEDSGGFMWRECQKVFKEMAYSEKVDFETGVIAENRLKEIKSSQELPRFVKKNISEMQLGWRKLLLSKRRWQYKLDYIYASWKEPWRLNPRNLPLVTHSVKNQITRVLSSYFERKFYSKTSTDEPLKNKNVKYILFFLHAQPEETIDQSAFKYKNQIVFIENLVANLPINYVILIKEHNAYFGMRPKGFYYKLARIPRVVLMKLSIHPHQLIRNSDYVVTLTGTVGVEALFYQKPVFVFGNVFYNSFDCINHINSIESFREMILKEDFVQPSEFDAIRFLTSSYLTSSPGVTPNPLLEFKCYSESLEYLLRLL